MLSVKRLVLSVVETLDARLSPASMAGLLRVTFVTFVTFIA